MSITGGLTVTAVLIKTIFFFNLYKKKRSYNRELLCCTYSLHLCVVVCAECDFTWMYVTFVFTHFIHSLFLYQCGPPHVLPCCFSVRDFIKMLSFHFVFQYCKDNTNKDIIFYDRWFEDIWVLADGVFRKIRKNICGFCHCLSGKKSGENFMLSPDGISVIRGNHG